MQKEAQREARLLGDLQKYASMPEYYAALSSVRAGLVKYLKTAHTQAKAALDTEGTAGFLTGFIKFERADGVCRTYAMLEEEKKREWFQALALAGDGGNCEHLVFPPEDFRETKLDTLMPSGARAESLSTELGSLKRDLSEHCITDEVVLDVLNQYRTVHSAEQKATKAPKACATPAHLMAVLCAPCAPPVCSMAVLCVPWLYCGLLQKFLGHSSEFIGAHIRAAGAL